MNTIVFNTFKRFKVPALLSTLILPLLFCSQAQSQVKWDLPAAYPATNFHSENLVQFAQEVEQATAGKLKITVHANASLFKSNEIKRAVQSGQAAMGEILLVNYENENPIFGLDGIPFLATSYSMSKKLADVQKPYLDKILAAQGLKLLFTVAWPPQGIFVSKEINAVVDMKGLKWRAYSPSTAKIAELVYAQPVTIQAAELSQALATGVVNSYMSSASTGFDTKTYESVKFFYDTQAWLPKNAVIVNQKAFDSLDKTTQDTVLKLASQAQARGWKVSQDKNEWYLNALTEHGMKILKPSTKLISDFKQLGEVMLGDWEKKAGSDGVAIVEQFKKK
jgi:TRAP-type C4-dicarboxylate transport system substrate-binding protein